MVQLVEAERRANRVSFDVLNLTEPGDVVRWMKQSFLAAVPIPDTDKMLPETFDPNGLLCRDQRHARCSASITPRCSSPARRRSR